MNKTKHYTSLFHFIYDHLKPFWPVLALLQFFALAWSLDSSLWPYIIKLLTDTIVSAGDNRENVWEIVRVPILYGLFLWIILEIFFRLVGILQAYYFPRIEAKIRIALFDYALHHSIRFFTERFSGNIANKISDMPKSLSRILETITRVVIPVYVAIAISLFIFAKVQPLFAVLLGTWFLLHITLSIFFAKKCFYTSEIHAETQSVLAGKLIDSITNFLNVNLFSQRDTEHKIILNAQDNEIRAAWKDGWQIEKLKIWLGLLTFLGPGISITWYLLICWQQHLMSTGDVIYILNTTFNMTLMAWILGLELPRMFRDTGIMLQAFQIIKTPHEIIDLPNAQPHIIQKASIEFKNITFQYGSKQTLFNNQNIYIEPGQKVGLIGYSGSGKSSFVNLILRLFDVQGGKILIDDKDIRSFTINSLHEQIATIPQDPQLFHRSIFENIQYGKKNATHEEVLEAARRAYCDEFVLKLKDGYHTIVGERGTKLSGGQRQRIAIARAILKNAPIIILDEATSALDSATEKLIQLSMHELMQRRTSIVIAHRLATLADMERILVFDKGIIVEDGTPQQLLEQKGVFYKLWNIQRDGFILDDTESVHDEDDLSWSESRTSESS